jgi:hypothetical protein
LSKSVLFIDMDFYSVAGFAEAQSTKLGSLHWAPVPEQHTLAEQVPRRLAVPDRHTAVAAVSGSRHLAERRHLAGGGDGGDAECPR